VEKMKFKNDVKKSMFHFEEGYSLSQAIIEVDRCLLCYDAPCNEGCPAETDPGKFIKKLRLKNLKGAIKTIKENNILGGICGIVCPVDKLCEEKCLATGIDRPINIGKLQRFLVEYGWQIGFSPITKRKNKNIKVAVVGSGPAGLTCAAELAKEGYNVTIFEGNEKLGGNLRYGVPSFKLSHDFLDREIEDILPLGVKIKCNSPITGKGSIENLLNKGFKAVFVSIGLTNPYRVNIPGINLKNVITSSDFLRDVNNGNIKKVSNMVKNKNVAIIGGGSVAMDTAITCKILKGDRVYSIALESQEELPADRADLHKAIDYHVIIKPQSQIKEIIDKNGVVIGVRGVEIEWIKPGDLSFSNIREIPDTEFSLKVDTVIFAIGSGPDPKIKEELPSVKFNKKGLIGINKKTYLTSVKGIFAGGDIVNGPGLVVNAVEDGKKVAKSIMKFLEKEIK
jgi:NADPH-dependent glutamate synthase beta subunit-like oxidoreductase